jgi:hypothetical protein
MANGTTAKVCPFLTIGASQNVSQELIQKGIMVIYASCTKECMLYVANKVTLPGQESGTCGLTKDPTPILRGGSN